MSLPPLLLAPWKLSWRRRSTQAVARLSPALRAATRRLGIRIGRWIGEFVTFGLAVVLFLSRPWSRRRKVASFWHESRDDRSPYDFH